jgi:hypothetical protein
MSYFRQLNLLHQITPIHNIKLSREYYFYVVKTTEIDEVCLSFGPPVPPIIFLVPTAVIS